VLLENQRAAFSLLILDKGRSIGRARQQKFLDGFACPRLHGRRPPAAATKSRGEQ